jgi:hypothetical protein
MPRSASPTTKQMANLSVDKMRAGIDRLRKRIEEVTRFDPHTVSEQYNIPEIDKLSAAVDDSLARTFGPNTVEYDRYKAASHFNNGAT